MNTLSKPTRLNLRLWVFLCLGASLLVSCQPDPPSRPFSQAPPRKISNSSNTDFVGLPLEEATAKATQAKLRWRVVRIDGKSRPVTKDYRPDRLNFEVAQGKITRVTKG